MSLLSHLVVCFTHVITFCRHPASSTRHCQDGQMPEINNCLTILSTSSPATDARDKQLSQPDAPLQVLYRIVKLHQTSKPGVCQTASSKQLDNKSVSLKSDRAVVFFTRCIMEDTEDGTMYIWFPLTQ